MVMRVSLLLLLVGIRCVAGATAAYQLVQHNCTRLSDSCRIHTARWSAGPDRSDQQVELALISQNNASQPIRYITQTPRNSSTATQILFVHVPKTFVKFTLIRAGHTPDIQIREGLRSTVHSDVGIRPSQTMLLPDSS